MSKIFFQKKNEKILIQTISAYPNMPWKINFQIALLPFLTQVMEKVTVLIVRDSVVSCLRKLKCHSEEI